MVRTEGTSPDGSRLGRPLLSRRAVVGGGLWTVAERVISQGAQLVILVIAARVLGPAEFGVFALVSAAAMILSRVAELGWGPFILSWDGDDRVPRQVITLAAASGLAVAALGAAVALALTRWEGLAGAAPLALAFAAWVPLAAVSSAQRSIVQWQGRLATASACEIAGEAVGLAVAVWALMEGHGVMALAYGRLAMQSAHIAATFAVTRLPPVLGMSGAPLRALMAYNAQMLASRAVGYARGYIATFVIGGFLGPASVGWYRAAERLVGAVTEVIGVPAEKLAWSQMREARDGAGGGVGSDMWTGRFEIWCKALLGIGLPALVWLSAMGEDVIALLLGPGWEPALPVIALLALSQALQLPRFALDAALSLAGNLRRLAPLMLLLAAVALALTLAAAPFGMVPVAGAQIAAGAIALAAILRALSRHAALPAAIALRACARVVPAVLVAGIALLALREAGFAAQWHPALRAFALPLPAVPVYLAALAALDPDLRGWAAARLRRAA